MQSSVLPVPLTVSPDSILYVNLSEVVQMGYTLRILGQNMADKLAKER